MAAPRFCESCGTELPAGARFCEACGAAVPQDAPPARTSSPAAPASAAHKPPAAVVADLPAHENASVPMPPPTRRASTGLLLAAAALVLAGAVAFWFATRPADPPQVHSAPISTGDVQTGAAPPERLPARAPVTRTDIELLKAAVDAANRAHVAAILASRDSPPPELRVQVNQAIGALGQALYRHHVEDGHGDLAAARAEMRAFLEGLDRDGLGFSEPAIDAGVADVAP